MHVAGSGACPAWRQSSPQHRQQGAQAVQQQREGSRGPAPAPTRRPCPGVGEARLFCSAAEPMPAASATRPHLAEVQATAQLAVALCRALERVVPEALLLVAARLHLVAADRHLEADLLVAERVLHLFWGRLVALHLQAIPQQKVKAQHLLATASNERLSWRADGRCGQHNALLHPRGS